MWTNSLPACGAGKLFETNKQKRTGCFLFREQMDFEKVFLQTCSEKLLLEKVNLLICLISSLEVGCDCNVNPAQTNWTTGENCGYSAGLNEQGVKAALDSQQSGEVLNPP